MLPILYVIVGTLCGILFGIQHYSEFHSLEKAVLYGGAFAAFAALCMAGVISVFNSMGRGLNALMGHSTQFRFWKYTFLGMLGGFAIVNLALGIYSADKTGDRSRAIARDLFQPIWNFDVNTWMIALAAFWHFYVIAALIIGLIAALASTDTSPSSDPWYVKLGIIAAIVIVAFPPTAVFALFALLTFLVFGFAAVVVTAVYSMFVGSENFVRKLHSRPTRFGVFYSFVGGASGTYVALSQGAATLSSAPDSSMSIILVAWFLGSALAITFGSLIKSMLGLQWEYQTA
jgi:hypothetical protein